MQELLKKKAIFVYYANILCILIYVNYVNIRKRHRVPRAVFLAISSVFARVFPKYGGESTGDYNLYNYVLYRVNPPGLMRWRAVQWRIPVVCAPVHSPLYGDALCRH